MTTTFYILPIVALLAFLLTGLLRQYALSKRLVDIPNARSSHQVPTPRGGGVSFVICFLFGLIFLSYVDYVDAGLLLSLFGAGLFTALIGLLDDHGHVPARWRLLGHFIAAAWGLYWLGGVPPISLMGFQFEPSLIGQVLALIYLVWMLNLYNFMDGINGIASVQAICACVGGGVLLYLKSEPLLAIYPLLLSAAVLGFMLWNFPRAFIFMGDAGSGFLGILLALLSLYFGWLNSDLFLGWLILLGVFISDATLTLVRRLLRGDKIYEAHRSHAYQYASRRFGSHVPVTFGVALINVFWLLPMASFVVLEVLDGFWGVIVAYLPLVCFWLKFSAGK
ncbi:MULTISPECIES: MraY family glycosyltransferase [Pseudomonas]|uniref:MraY family glycosyltransferase n=1 Tax=Pseudomonas TaxID=286 RepID=UPI000DA9142D|nr:MULTISPECIES: glycosyltransferase family 4 protein [Pseudomonas]MDW3713528.1 glycosyltransferase family 4 protein [Pseudomonas sp. 2023EL-01195]PZE15197.1 glycosyl transferase [Pseudomonas sp. 57B-090624]GJN46985.1 glycosyl transferase [Pseudomonas tohonis]